MDVNGQGVYAPEPEWFYLQFADDVKEGRVHWERPVTAERLAKGTGLTDEDAKTVIQKARALLPAHVSNMKAKANKDLLEDITDNFLSDPEVFELLRPKFKSSCITVNATKFFDEVPARWVRVANGENRRGVPAPVMPPNQVQPNAAQAATPVAPVADPVAMQRLLQSNAPPATQSHALAQAPNLHANATATSNSIPPNGTQQASRRAGLSNANPIVILDDDEEDVKIKKEEQAEDHHPKNNTKGVEQVKKRPTNMIHLQRVQEPRAAALAYLGDMFHLTFDPSPIMVNIHTIRQYWNDHLRLSNIPPVNLDRIWFKYASSSGEIRINNDVNLRFAYRVWQAADVPGVPFQLEVEHV